MFVFLFHCFVSSQVNQSSLNLSVQGIWSDSYLIDETKLFFDFVYPSGNNYVDQLENSNPQIFSSIQSIINSMKAFIPNNILGLLNLTLHMRYFNPMASTHNPIPNKRPNLKGWSVLMKKNLPEMNYIDFQWKYATYLYSLKTTTEKINFLKHSIHSFKDVAPKLTSIPPNPVYEEEFRQRKIPSNKPLSIINGRSTEFTIDSIFEALINEYHYVSLFDSFNITDPNVRYRFFNSQAYRKAYNYLTPLNNFGALAYHDYHDFKKKFGTTLKINETYPESFIQVNLEMIFPQVFLSTKEPAETAAAVEFMLAEVSYGNPIGYDVFINPDFNNETDVIISYAFEYLYKYLGPRSACEFILDAYTHGGTLSAFKKAFKSKRPKISWKEVKELISNESSVIDQCIKTITKYTNEHNITGFAISVNGEFIEEKPSVPHIKSYINKHIIQLMDLARFGEISNTTNFNNLIQDIGIPINTPKTPLHISDQNIIPFPFSVKEIVSMIDYFSEIANQNQQEQPYLPIIFVDPENKDHIPEIQGLKTLTITSCKYLKKGTIVGPLRFNKFLSPAELSYAIFYAIRSFSESFKGVTEKQFLFINFWRANMKLNGIKRAVKEVLSSPSLIFSGYQNPLVKEFEWYIRMNPLTPEFQPVIEMISQVHENEIAKIAIIPSFPINQMKPPANLAYQYIPSITFSNVIINNPDWEIIIPSSWTGYHSKNDNCFLITGIAQYGYVFPMDIFTVDKVTINGTEHRVIEDGFFLGVFTPGEISPFSYYASSHFIELEVPEQKIDYHSNENDDALNVLTFLLSSSFENFSKLMIYSLIQNTSCPVHIWTLNAPRMEMNIQYPNKITILPRFWPPILPSVHENQLCFGWKLAIADMYLPPSISSYIFADQNLVFRRSADKLRNFNFENAAVAAPLATSYKDSRNNRYYNTHDYIVKRYKRPFHSTQFMIFGPNWLKFGASMFRNLLKETLDGRGLVRALDDDLFNILQMKVQVMTLPENVAFCSQRSESKKAKDAFSIMICDESSKKFVGHFEKLYKDASNEL